MRLHNRLLSVGCISSALVGGSLLHPVVSGQVTATTHQGGAIGQGLVPAAGLFVGLALLLGLVAFRAHIPAVDRVVSSTTTKRGATIAVVGLVVTTAALSGVGGPASPTGSASAETISINEQCDAVDLAITGITFTASDYFRDEADRCVQSYESDTTNLTETDAVATMSASESTSDTFLTTNENFENDVRGVMWSKAKVEVINAIQNNKSEAEALNQSKEAVTNYTTSVERNILSDWNARILQAAYIAKATENEEGYSTFIRGLDNGEAWGKAENDTRTHNYTLYDGTNTTAHALWYKAGAGNYKSVSQMDPYDEYVTPSQSPVFTRAEGVDAYDAPVRIDSGRYNQLVRDHRSAADQVKSNLDVYVNETYQAVENGTLNTTDLVVNDPQTIATQAATDYNSTGYYGLASAQLAALGISGNENVSHVVDTTENGSARTISGTLFYTGDDGQQFATGTTYDPSNLSGSVYMSVSTIEDGNGTELNKTSGFYHLNENFTVQNSTNTQTGEAVNTTMMEVRDYDTTNTSELEEEISRYAELREYYEQQLAAGGGGGFSLDFGGTGTGMLIALAAVVVLLAGTRD